MTTIFALAFVGKDFYRGIARNESLSFGKNAAYELLKRPSHNWPKVLLVLLTHGYVWSAPVIGMFKKTSKVL